MGNCEWSLTKQFAVISPIDILQDANNFGDTNPIHREKGAATAKGYRDIIAPFLTSVRFLDSAIAENIPGVVITCLQNVKIRKPMYPGVAPKIVCHSRHERGRSRIINFTILGDDEKLISGSCTLLLPESTIEA